MSESSAGLAALCRAAGVETAWHDALGGRHTPPDDALRAVLRALGIETRGPADDADALARLERERDARVVEPVLLARPETPIALALRHVPPGAYAVDVRAEGQDDGPPLASARGVLPGDDAPVDVRLPPLPVGRFGVRVETRSGCARATLLVAPASLHPVDPRRAFGLFAPVFALRRTAGRPGGTLTDLAAFAAHAGDAGAGVIATLPLLPAFDGERSPYAPISRCFWNERLVDPRTLPGAAGRTDDTLALSERFFDAGGASEPSYRAWLARTPRARAYARYRAERDAAAPARSSRGAAPALAPLARRHLFLQWAADVQVARLGAIAARRGPGLLLDLPVGAHPDGFDRADAPSLYAEDASIGAPPDELTSVGQTWGLPLVRPEASRAEGHASFAAAVRHLARHAGLLRIDHVMGLHRLFAVPRGMDAAHGTYVRFPAREMWAALAIESHRARCAVIGEDLGVVPDEVRETMAARGALRTWVALFDLGGEEEGHVPNEPPASSVASLTTHDTPTFAGFVRGRDIDVAERLGRLDRDRAAARRRERAAIVERLRARLLPGADESGDAALLRALLARLAASPARLVVAALDDLLLVEEPVNVPGTTHERRNWTARHDRTIAEALGDEGVRAALEALRRD